MLRKTMCMMMVGVALMGVNSLYAQMPVKEEASINKENTTQTIAISYKTTHQRFKTKQGQMIFEWTCDKPTFKTLENTEAIAKINQFFASEAEKNEGEKKKTLKIAREDYAMRTKEERKRFLGYTSSIKYTSKRMDDGVISMVQEDYEYTGGAHPTSYYMTFNFDGKTGKTLKLQDVVTDKQEAVKYIEKYIINQIETTKTQEEYFEDYKENISQIIEDSTWYFNDEGIVIIANEYIITCHAVGMKEFVIPYEDCPFLRAEYKVAN